MTRWQRKNHWGGGIAAQPAPPQYILCRKIRSKILSSLFSLIIFQRAKLSTRSVTQLRLWIWRKFLRKKGNETRKSPRESCTCSTMPRLTGHLQPRRNWPTWASSVLILYRIIRICPCRSTTCSLYSKYNSNFTIFLPKWKTLLTRISGWTVNIRQFILVACISYSNVLTSVLNFVKSALNKSLVWSM